MDRSDLQARAFQHAYDVLSRGFLDSLNVPGLHPDDWDMLADMAERLLEACEGRQVAEDADGADPQRVTRSDPGGLDELGLDARTANPLIRAGLESIAAVVQYDHEHRHGLARINGFGALRVATVRAAIEQWIAQQMTGLERAYQ